MAVAVYKDGISSPPKMEIITKSKLFYISIKASVVPKAVSFGLEKNLIVSKIATAQHKHSLCLRYLDDVNQGLEHHDCRIKKSKNICLK